MTTMTKITKITVDSAVFFAIRDKIENKIAEMVSLASTDGEIVTENSDTFIRYWADQESAQEWIDFISATLASVGVAYISAEILDNPDL